MCQACMELAIQWDYFYVVSGNATNSIYANRCCTQAYFKIKQF